MSKKKKTPKPQESVDQKDGSGATLSEVLRHSPLGFVRLDTARMGTWATTSSS